MSAPEGGASLILTAEQEELRAAVRRFCAEVSPPERVRELMETAEGYDPAAWARMTSELGLAALAVPERHGGAGFGIGELAVAAEEAGAALLPGPFWSSAVLSALLLTELADGSPPAAALLAETAAGAITTVAYTGLTSPAPEPPAPRVTGTAGTAGRGGPPTLGALPVVAGSADAYRISGVVPYVTDAMAAARILVVAELDGAPAVFAVDAADAARTPLTGLDPTRRQARVEFADTPGGWLGPSHRDGLHDALERALDRARVVLAAEQLGVARRALDITAAYTAMRYQFGRPIGAFQAVRHGLADLYVDCELLESAVRDAAFAADHEAGRLPIAAATAQAYASPAAFNAAAQAIQYHGGIGYTWEHDAHLYYKRAKTDEHLLGDGGRHLDRLATLLGGHT